MGCHVYKTTLNIISTVPDDYSASISETGERVTSIRWNAESLCAKIQKIGDGHSSEDVRDRKTLSERRTISLNKRKMKHKSQRRMLC